MKQREKLIIGVLNQKGGVGKTTLSVNLGCCLSGELRRRCMLIDADPQESALDWYGACDNPTDHDRLLTVVSYARPLLHKKISSIGEGYSVVIIDGPPRNDDIQRSIILAADVILIPITPSPYDVWAVEGLIKLIDEASNLKVEPIKVAFVINRRIANTAIARDVIESLNVYGKRVFKSTIAQRVIFAEAASMGLSVGEAMRECAAKLEIDAVVSELKEWIYGKAN